MQHIYFRISIVSLSLFLLPLFIAAQSDSLSSAYFSLDNCAANFGNLEHLDYSEFTAEVDNSGDCADIRILGGTLYRANPEENMHSCSEGVNGNPAMCVGTHHDCSFTTGDHALRVDVQVTPGPDGVGILSGLSFYEKAPTQYNWLNGGSGPNDYPRYFAVLVLVNDSVIYRSTGNPTQQEWNLRTFDFSSRPAFTVTETTTFNIELYSYCPVNTGASVSAWDVDELRVLSDCCVLADGGDISGGPFEFCVGDGEPDYVSGVSVTGDVGSKAQYVVTDEDGTILALPPAPDSVNFDGAGPGICYIYHVSYYGTLGGLEMGNNLADLEGDCFGLSDAITVVRNQQPEGGALIGGPYRLCVGDGEDDFLDGLILGGNTGGSSLYIITDTANVILAITEKPDSINFDTEGPGISLVWHLSYDVAPTGLEVGNDLMDDVDGCIGLSNPVMVTSNQIPTAGELSGGPFTFCVGDSIPDYAEGVVVTGNTGPNNRFVITDDQNVILKLAMSPSTVDFDGAGSGVCFIWHITYAGNLTGLEEGNNLMTDVEGCFALSNPVRVQRNQPDGGELTGGPFEICVDSIPDFVSGVELSGQVGEGSQYVVTDTLLNILGLPPAPDSVDFNAAGPGVCLIWHVSYYDSLAGAVIGNNAGTDLEGCFDLSNPIEVVRLESPCEDSLGGGPQFDFMAFPNPAHNEIELRFYRSGDEDHIVQIYDIYGRMCTEKVCQRAGDNSVDVSKLPEGHYFVKVRSANGYKTHSIVLLR